MTKKFTIKDVEKLSKGELPDDAAIHANVERHLLLVNKVNDLLDGKLKLESFYDADGGSYAAAGLSAVVSADKLESFETFCETIVKGLRGTGAVWDKITLVGDYTDGEDECLVLQSHKVENTPRYYFDARLSISVEEDDGDIVTTEYEVQLDGDSGLEVGPDGETSGHAKG